MLLPLLRLTPPLVLFPVSFRPFIGLSRPLVEAASAASFKRLRDMHCKKLPSFVNRAPAAITDGAETDACKRAANDGVAADWIVRSEERGGFFFFLLLILDFKLRI